MPSNLTRSQLAVVIAELVDTPDFTIDDARDGWPAFATLLIGGQPTAVALFVGPVTRSQRNRDAVERRYQNPAAVQTPGKPITVPPGRLPLLVGLWDGDDIVPVARPILAAADPWVREGNTTRYSIFTNLAAMQSGIQTGWTEHTTASGERMVFMTPELLPVYAMAIRDNVHLPESDVQIVVDASGFEIQPELQPVAERMRRAATRVVREARFARDVVTAYSNLCALCGLDLGLVQAAHIYPASAPESPDDVRNGVALCANHHLAFDRHLIHVGAESRAIQMHPTVLTQYESNSAARALVDMTAKTLGEPSTKSARPVDEMFYQRYAYFDGSYAWAS